MGPCLRCGRAEMADVTHACIPQGLFNPALMHTMTCCRCGLAESEHTGDGSGGRAWRERNCSSYVLHPSG
jgi:hypothetical protein